MALNFIAGACTAENTEILTLVFFLSSDKTLCEVQY